ncbi:hypothetical protein NVP1152O_082 [Vibrio phage 1.152.O._10N.222.46.E1]|uniref:Winged helix-turn-helix DNA-binding domain protein n=5 Tax=Nahantvirus 49C7 TaxID=2846601 RepID=A0A2I7RBH4_9CAUD|nr:HNH endonuclease [Vibrio phage 1.026.O._10N.222.49.C7]AUR82564.1 hypothetical protein NVP1025O_081 [Vibrio phage 1.025.O._10N.222.46.B6]AUR90814.1 hypothetical protein NVP1150O_081 [Vibrio phage 1.150.O._10N.222.46.A6]AUR90987.1 hypothetical protein NVP1152O_082 [Vibrio phage 1.152.O._10N.222.46.E1]AUS02455.1 hypothetical protein NVP2130O_081 [Vibrio phage 2.130.O._10N.222.46.C2]AUR82672.1 hypothetical protein NVP1026O_081 [Vibrio phage 1.026.O._10N.222.49.C7]
MSDRLKPTVAGVGYLGEGDYPATNSKGQSVKCYAMWRNMLARCYVEHDPAFRWYGGKGITVCDEWHCYQTFAAWVAKHFIEGYQLDKDTKVPGSKVYSPDTCTFINAKANSIAASAKHYVFLDPKGNRVEIYNLHQFCKDHGLHTGHMSDVHNSKNRSHKKWTKA